MKHSKIILALLGALAVAATARVSAASAIDIAFQSANITEGIFNYTLTLNNSNQLTAGDGFTFYDFEGFVPGATTLTPLTGGGSLSMANFAPTFTTTDSTPAGSLGGQGNDLNNSAALNTVVQTDADNNGLSDSFADPNSSTDGLSNPTFDNPEIYNVSFVFDAGSSYNAADTETYLLTLFTSVVNTNEQVSMTEVGSEAQDSGGDPSYGATSVYTPNGPGEVPVDLPEPSTLGLLAIGAIYLNRRKAR
jgi:PEP-CTERM motif